jgi:hypothetical protein
LPGGEAHVQGAGRHSHLLCRVTAALIIVLVTARVVCKAAPAAAPLLDETTDAIIKRTHTWTWTWTADAGHRQRHGAAGAPGLRCRWARPEEVRLTHGDSKSSRDAGCDFTLSSILYLPNYDGCRLQN